VQIKISSIWQSWTLVSLSLFVLVLVLPAPSCSLSCPSKSHLNGSLVRLPAWFWLPWNAQPNHWSSCLPLSCRRPSCSLSCPSKMHPLASHASWSLHLGLRSSLHLHRLLHVSCACGNSAELAHLHVCAWFPLQLGASCSLGWPRRLGLVLSVCAARGITGISITSRFRYSFKSILRGRIFVQ
jgi:hypothetical protein